MTPVDSSILQSFVEEAFTYLPVIKQGIAHGGAEKEMAFRHAHTLRGASLMLGLEELGEYAGFVEDSLEPTLSDNREIADPLRTDLMLKVVLIESLLDRVIVESGLAETPEKHITQNNVITAQSPSGNLFDVGEIARLIAEDGNLNALGITFDDLPSDSENEAEEISMSSEPSLPKAVEETVETETDGDIDPEMLSIFALEAEDHLRNIGAHLALLEHSPNNRASLAEVRRSAHTLKGAAGVVGFRLITQLAHRMEDLLDRVADNELESTPESVSVLLASTDILESLARGTKEEFFQSEVERIYGRFDKLLQSESIEETQSNEVFAPVEPLLEIPLGESDSFNDFVAATTSRPAVEVTSTPATSVTIGEVFADTTDDAYSTVKNSLEPRAVIRVSLDRVDEIVKVMGEIVISRSVIEQRLAHAERQLSELNLSNQRLRRIASKLEIDYEVQSLNNGWRTSGANVVGATFANGNTAPNAYGLNQDFDALEFDNYTEFHQTTRELVEASQDSTETGVTMKNLLVDMNTLLARQKRFTDEMQDRLMKLRMVPFGALSQRLQRTVKVAAEQDGKQVQLIMTDEDVEIDTQILDAITEPLLHMLRNSVAHGIESSEERVAKGKPSRGTITLKAFHEGTDIVLSINDDGGGIIPDKLRGRAVRGGFLTFDQAASMSDEEAQNLVFLPGLSTSEKISEISGRGVGMDIVRTVVERRQGTLKLSSTPGVGTMFTLRLPMSLVVTKAVIVRAADQKFAIPQNIIRAVKTVSSEDLDRLTQSKTFALENEDYRVTSLNELLDLPFSTEGDNSGEASVILLNTSRGNIALIVEQTLDSSEIVIKKLTPPLDKLRILLGATVLGDGSVVPILNMVNLLVTSSRNFIVPTSLPHLSSFAVPEQINVMIVDDSPSVRRVMTKLISGAGWQCSAAKDGIEALELLRGATQLPHVILSDVEMPRMDGYEFVATLKADEDLSSIPVVMITSRGGTKHREKGFALGVAEYITKPYEEDFLLNTVRNLSTQKRG